MGKAINIKHHGSTDWFFTRVFTGQLDPKPWVTIGNFDGCHLGHHSLFNETLKQSRGNAVAVTFYPHPVEVFGKESIYYVDTLPYRLKKMMQFGFRQIWVINFTLAFSQTPWDVFLDKLFLHSGIQASGVCVGPDFEFGHQKAGNAIKLQSWLKRLKIPCKVMGDVKVGDRRVSSRWIRSAINEGDIQTVVQKLGCDYALTGIVQKGARLGHKLGLPTANVHPASHQLLPPLGVYVAETVLDSRKCASVVNIGYRPTIESEEHRVVVESHILNFNENIYGEYLEIRLLHKLRPEKKFKSLDVLKKQIQKDVVESEKFFKKHKLKPNG